jgi:predicted phosphodiesterase
MYFQIASDIHIEKISKIDPVITDYIIPSAPNLILAGDIGSIYRSVELTHFLRSCNEHFESVIFVPGNNEYYLREGHTIKPMEELNQDLERICKETGVYLLNNAYIETEELIIFGSTWWSYIPDILNMNVNIGSKKMTSDDFNYLHNISRLSLNKLLMQNISNKKVLVVSHYCPTKLGTMNSHHKKDDFTNLVPYYFSSSEKYLKKSNVDTWIFGHTHVFRDFVFNGDQTRIISNADPRKKFFRRDFVIYV